jgi:hypothetical protein
MFIINTTTKEYFVNLGEEETRQMLTLLLKENYWLHTDTIKTINSPVLISTIYGQYMRLSI